MNVTPVDSARKTLAGRISGTRGPSWIALNAVLLLLTPVLLPPALLAMSAALLYEKAVHGHTARVKRALVWVLNLRLPGLLLALLILMAVPFWVIGVVERLRYGQGSRREQGVAILLLVAVLLGAPFVLEEYGFFLVAQAAVFTLMALSITTLTGYLGEVSIGQGAFVLVGAYVPAVLLAGKLGQFPGGVYGAVALGALAATLLGAVISLPSIRLSGMYLSLVTLSLAVAAPLILKSRYLTPYTDGAVGLVLDKPVAPTWVARYLTDERWQYFIILLPTVSLVALGARLLQGRFGRILKSIRDSDVAAEMSGVPVSRYKVLAFALSAFFAGAGGSLWVLVLGFVSADSYGVLDSVNLLAASVIGGLGSFVGAVVGGVFLAFQPDLNSFIARLIPRGDDLHWAIYGALVIGVMLAAPRGLGGALYKKR